MTVTVAAVLALVGYAVVEGLELVREWVRRP